jgi:UDP-N-acetylglucosamine 1-carboxyvinyltransferase
MTMPHTATVSLQDAAPWWQPRSGHALLVRGGAPLCGTYRVSGAKNAALPLMISALLTPHLVTLHEMPGNLDVAVLAALLQRLGAGLSWSRGEDGLSLTICADRIHSAQVDPALVTRMRASVLLLGALLARCGEARLPLPGGDAIGLRGIDFHLAGLRAMGAQIAIEEGMIQAAAPRGLRGAEIVLPQVSVGATENLLLAAVRAEGTSRIGNAAREPEILDLAQCLVAMGARIDGLGTASLIVEGGATLGGAVHRVLPDRIEMGTLACAAALTDGEIFLANFQPALLGAAAPALAAAGVALQETPDGVIARRAPGGLVGIDVLTQPFPGFATDLQAPIMALLTQAKGASSVTETIFEQRFRHVDELRKMGAEITVHGRTAMLRGVARLHGAAVTATDVRAGAALLIAGLAASGETAIDGLDHLDRGYDEIAEKLARCGAVISRA